MKTSSKILLSVSGAITAVFVIMCIVETVDNKGRDNIMQLLAGYFFYAIFFLLPAAILAATALFPREKTILPITGAVVSVLLAAIMLLLLKVLWIMTVPAFVSAALCAVFAIKSKKRGKV